MQYKPTAPRLVCADGVSLSVQASRTHYCTPRADTGPYETVEVGFPSAPVPDSWAQFADGEHPSDVYGYVPVALVNEFIAAHGGLDVGRWLCPESRQ